jgi:hypothetical protein
MTYGVAGGTTVYRSLRANGEPKPRNPRRRPVPKVDPASLRNVPDQSEPVVAKSPPKRKGGSEKSINWKARHRAVREAKRGEQHLFQEHAWAAESLCRHHGNMLTERRSVIARPKVPKLRPPRSPELRDRRHMQYVRYASRFWKWHQNRRPRYRLPRYVPSWYRKYARMTTILA